MPVALILAGVGLLLLALSGDPKRLFTLIAEDVTTGGFPVWIVAVVTVGAIGFIKPAENGSRLFLALIVIVFVLANGGLFDKAATQFNHKSPARSLSGNG